MKYLIVKGYLGFGDRLESLKMCIEYAIRHNLQIYVDWRDSIWSHGDESFYTYFKLVNMPVLESLYDIPANATVFPEFWKDKLHDPLTEDIIKNQKETGINIGILREVYDSDVVVYSCIGRRQLFINSNFFGEVFRVIDPRILKEVSERKLKYDLRSAIGIHIRGTDRVRSQHMREQSIQYTAVRTFMNGGFSGKPLIAVSDDAHSLEIWRRFYPHTQLVTNITLNHTHSKGIHNITKDDDSSCNKDMLNVDMLCDFFTLSMCNSVITTFQDSRFAREAQRVSPFLSKILGNG